MFSDNFKIHDFHISLKSRPAALGLVDSKLLPVLIENTKLGKILVLKYKFLFSECK